MREPADAREQSLLALLACLAMRGYRFTTISPASHARVLARRPGALASDLRDVLGWSRPFQAGTIDAEVETLLDRAGALERVGDTARATVRVSSLGRQLLLHSAYPTEAEDAVFFGPDSYRFAAAVEAELSRQPLPESAHIVDIGAGSGVGGIAAALARPDARVTLTDVNSTALSLARINAAAAGVNVRTLRDEDLSQVEDPIDFAIANPPYIVDDAGRAYRDGGDLMGGKIALDMARTATARLTAGGRFLLYTGATIVDGRSQLLEALEDLAARRDLRFAWREIDPDVFGEELSNPAYAGADRIAVVVATFGRG